MARNFLRVALLDNPVPTSRRCRPRLPCIGALCRDYCNRPQECSSDDVAAQLENLRTATGGEMIDLLHKTTKEIAKHWHKNRKRAMNIRLTGRAIPLKIRSEEPRL